MADCLNVADTDWYLSAVCSTVVCGTSGCHCSVLVCSVEIPIATKQANCSDVLNRLACMIAAYCAAYIQLRIYHVCVIIISIWHYLCLKVFLVSFLRIRTCKTCRSGQVPTFGRSAFSCLATVWAPQPSSARIPVNIQRVLDLVGEFTWSFSALHLILFCIVVIFRTWVHSARYSNRDSSFTRNQPPSLQELPYMLTDLESQLKWCSYSQLHVVLRDLQAKVTSCWITDTFCDWILWS